MYANKKLFSQKFVKDSLAATLFSSLGKAIGFLVPFFLATWFGSTAVTDTFYFIYSLLLFLAGIVTSTVSSVIVPYIAELKSRREDMGPFVNSLLFAGSLGICALLAACGILLALVLVLFPVFTGELSGFIMSMYLEMIPLVLFLVVSGILEGVLAAGKRFATSGVSVIIRSAITLAVILLLKDSWGLHAVTAGYVAGELSRLAVLVWVIRIKKLFHFRFLFDPSPRLRDFFHKTFFQILGVTAVAVNPIIDKIMAAWFPNGSVSLLYYGERFFVIPETLIVGGIMMTLLSYWSSRFHEHGITTLVRDVRNAALWFAVAGLCISAFFILNAESLVRLVYGRGELGPAELEMIRWITIGYFAGFMPYMMAFAYVRALVVLRKTRVILVLALVKMGCNIVFDLVLMNLVGLPGIPWATSAVNLIGLVVASVLFYATLRRSGKKNATGGSGTDIPPLDIQT